MLHRTGRMPTPAWWLNLFAQLGVPKTRSDRPHRGTQPTTVFWRAGTYHLDDAIVFTDKDSGSPNAPVFYRAFESEPVVVSGGRRLELDWQPYRNGILQAKTSNGVQFDQLFVDRERQVLARYPNYVPDVLPYHGFSADAFSPERAERWSNPAGGFIHAMHRNHWGGYHYRITGKKPNHEVTYEGG